MRSYRTAFPCSSIAKGVVEVEDSCACELPQKLFCGTTVMTAQRFNKEEIPEEIEQCSDDMYCAHDLTTSTELQPDEEEVDFEGRGTKVLHGVVSKCCCSSEVPGEPHNSGRILCRLWQDSDGCRQLVGKHYHSWNNMPSKYSGLRNYGRCVVPRTSDHMRVGLYPQIGPGERSRQQQKQRDELLDEEDVDFYGSHIKVIGGIPTKCCCASDQLGKPEESVRILCKLLPGDIGCKQHLGKHYHSWNKMGSKYSRLRNFGRCVVSFESRNRFFSEGHLGHPRATPAGLPFVRDERVVAQLGLTTPGPYCVFTDIDDTLVASGGAKGGVKGSLAGYDFTYYPHEIYPGAAQFGLEVGRGMTSSTPPAQVLLSARPKLFSLSDTSPDVLAWKDVAEKNGVNWGIDVTGAKYGNLLDVFAGYTQGFGETKVANWRQGCKEPNLASIFIGDDGQGDVYAGWRMLMESASAVNASQKVVAVFIHSVRPGDPAGWGDLEPRKYPQDRMFFFGTYASAAVQAHSASLMTMDGLARVLRSMMDSHVFTLCCMQNCPGVKYDGQDYQCHDINKASSKALAPSSLEACVKAPCRHEVFCDGQVKSGWRSISGPVGSRCRPLLREWKEAVLAWEQAAGASFPGREADKGCRCIGGKDSTTEV